MKSIIILFFILLISLSFAQTDNNFTPKKEPISHIIIEIMPVYQGGNKQMVKDLNNNLDLDKSISGVIFINFTVDSTGRAKGFKSLKGISEKIDILVINTLSSLQKWSPAKNGGQEVECNLTIKISIEKGKIKN